MVGRKSNEDKKSRIFEILHSSVLIVAKSRKKVRDILYTRLFVPATFCTFKVHFVLVRSFANYIYIYIYVCVLNNRHNS